MKTVLLLGGPAAGQRVEVHGAMNSYRALTGICGLPVETTYKVTPMCSHGEVHWFGVLDGADPLALLIAGYAPAPAKRGIVGMDLSKLEMHFGDPGIVLRKLCAAGVLTQEELATAMRKFS